MLGTFYYNKKKKEGKCTLYWLPSLVHSLPMESIALNPWSQCLLSREASLQQGL